MPTKTKIRVTNSAPGRPPSLNMVWTSSHVKPTSTIPPMSRNASPNGPS